MDDDAESLSNRTVGIALAEHQASLHDHERRLQTLEKELAELRQILTQQLQQRVSESDTGRQQAAQVFTGQQPQMQPDYGTYIVF